MSGLRRSSRILAKTDDYTPLTRMDGEEDSTNDVSLELDSSGDEWKRDKKDVSKTDDEEYKCTPPCKRPKFSSKPYLILTPVPTPGASLTKMSTASVTDKIPQGISVTLSPSKSPFSPVPAFTPSTTPVKSKPSHSLAPAFTLSHPSSAANESYLFHSPAPAIAPSSAADNSKAGYSSTPGFIPTIGISLTKPSTGPVTGQLPPGASSGQVQSSSPPSHQNTVQVEESPCISTGVVEAAQPTQSKSSHSTTQASTTSPATSLFSMCTPLVTDKIPPGISFSRVQPPSPTTKNSDEVPRSAPPFVEEVAESTKVLSGSTRVLAGLDSISITRIPSTSAVNHQSKSVVSHKDNQSKEGGVVQKDEVFDINKDQVIDRHVIDLTNSDVIDIDEDEPLKIVKLENTVKSERTDVFRFPSSARAGIKAEPGAFQFQDGRYHGNRQVRGAFKLGSQPGGGDSTQPRGRGMIRGRWRGSAMISGPGMGARRQLNLTGQGQRLVARSGNVGRRYPTAGPQFSPVGHVVMPGVRAVLPGVRALGPRGRVNAAPAVMSYGRGGLWSPAGSGGLWSPAGSGGGWSPAGRGVGWSPGGRLPAVRGAGRSPAVHLVSGNINPRGGVRGRGSINPGVAIALVIPASGDVNTELKIELNPGQVEVLKNCFTNN